MIFPQKRKGYAIIHLCSNHPQAQQIGLLIDKYHFIITNLDAHTIDLEPFQYSGANITILRMVDASSAFLTGYGDYVKQAAKKEKPAEEHEENPEDEGGEKTEEEEQGEASEKGDV